MNDQKKQQIGISEQKAGDSAFSLASIRHFVESVFIAIVLAFLLRAFLVEAFVIPTGSMATSLYGRHYNYECKSCGHRFSVSDSVPGRSGKPFCPNCGKNLLNEECQAAGGDHVIVLKYAYRFTEPEPWDVIVFKNPQNNTQNYIKRLIGLPGEAIQVVNGDVFYRKLPSKRWNIRRKPDHVQKILWQEIYNKDLPSDNRERSEWNYGVAGSGGWVRDNENRRVLRFSGSDHERELKFLPRPGFFGAVSSYNGNRGSDYNGNGGYLGRCTDLKIDGVVRRRDGGDSSFDVMIRGYGCGYKVSITSSGSVTLQYRRRLYEEWSEWGSGRFDPVKVGEGVAFVFEKADYRARVMINGKVVVSADEEDFVHAYDEAARRNGNGKGNDPVPANASIALTGKGGGV